MINTLLILLGIVITVTLTSLLFFCGETDNKQKHYCNQHSSMPNDWSPPTVLGPGLVSDIIEKDGIKLDTKGFHRVSYQVYDGFFIVPIEKDSIKARVIPDEVFQMITSHFNKIGKPVPKIKVIIEPTLIKSSKLHKYVPVITTKDKLGQYTVKVVVWYKSLCAGCSYMIPINWAKLLKQELKEVFPS